jgi:transcription elongation factor Elf1
MKEVVFLIFLICIISVLPHPRTFKCTVSGNKKHINSHIQNWNMTMNCPVCGAIMIWLNGSISHDPPIKYYECRVCNINVTKQPDGSYEIVEAKKQKQQ